MKKNVFPHSFFSKKDSVTEKPIDEAVEDVIKRETITPPEKMVSSILIFSNNFSSFFSDGCVVKNSKKAGERKNRITED